MKVSREKSYAVDMESTTWGNVTGYSLKNDTHISIAQSDGAVEVKGVGGSDN